MISSPRIRAGFVGLILLFAAPSAEGQTDNRWTWSPELSGGLAAFTYGDPIFANPRPDASGNLGGNWVEGMMEPSIRGGFRTGASRLFGEVSVIATGTGGAESDILGGNASAVRIEQAHVGWASGTLWPALGEDALRFTAGRQDYGIGTGMVLQGGSGNGEDRGAYWLAPRQAWALAVVGRLQSHGHAVQLFFLDRDEPTPEEEARFAGLNYEWSPGEDRYTLGGSWFRVVEADQATRDGLSVLSLRLGAAPLDDLPGLRLDGEYISEGNGDLLRSSGWYAAAEYGVDDVALSPSLRYRYAVFEGDDPGTSRSEAFDPLRYGFTDYGSWFQGEIYGGFLLGNSNLRSHQLVLQASPAESLRLRLFWYDFSLDVPATLDSGIGIRHLGGEADLVAEWEANPHLTFTLVLASGWLDDELQERFDHPGAVSYAMPYLAFTF